MAMAMIVRTIFIIVVIACAVAAPNNVAVKTINLTPEIIMAAGYHSERHHVVTVDDYILEMHRIPFARNAHSGPKDRPVVFLMHGLLGASNAYIALGPEYSIAYNLADAGFDVWMGNARGTRNSRLHVTLDPDAQNDRHQFFDFTWEQIGMYDIAGMVDYILEFTGRKQLHYIGHSQGGTVFLVLASTRPEYNEKFASVHLLAGVGYQNYFPHVLLRPLALFTNTIYSLALSLGVVEMFPPRSVIGKSGNKIEATTGLDTNQDTMEIDHCTGDDKLKDLCVLLGIPEIIAGLDDLNLETGGAALKQIAHYGQNIQDKQFRRWNYGAEENLKIYGSNEPPIYNLSLITANVTMHYTVSDTLLDERDVLDMAKVMPNTVTRRVARDSFGHVEFVTANDVRELVTDFIIRSIVETDFPKNETETEYEPENIATDASSTIVLSCMLKIYLVTYSLYVLLL